MEYSASDAKAPKPGLYIIQFNLGKENPSHSTDVLWSALLSKVSGMKNLQKYNIYGTFHPRGSLPCLGLGLKKEQ